MFPSTGNLVNHSRLSYCLYGLGQYQIYRIFCRGSRGSLYRMVVPGSTLAALSIFTQRIAPSVTVIVHCLSAADLSPSHHHLLLHPLPSFCHHCLQPLPSAAVSGRCSCRCCCCQPPLLTAADAIVDRCRQPQPSSLLTATIDCRHRHCPPPPLLTTAVDHCGRRRRRRCRRPPPLTAVAAAIFVSSSPPFVKLPPPLSRATAYPWQWKARVHRGQLRSLCWRTTRTTATSPLPLGWLSTPPTRAPRGQLR